jgi:RsiW-degrading membrane proteinase PrsW (M82 family)
MATEQPVQLDRPGLQLSRSTLFPLVGQRSAWSQEHLLPIFATIVVGIALALILHAHDTPTSDEQIDQAWQVYWLLALYMAFLVNCYIYEMCLRARHLWLMAAVGIATYVLLETMAWHYWSEFFRYVIPALQWRASDSTALQLAGWFASAGLSEEGFKAWPLFGLVALGAGLSALSRRAKGNVLLVRLARCIGLYEPLDGIVLGVASGSGFFVRETLGQYVPNTMGDAQDAGTQAFDGLVLLLSRGLPHLADHSAWSGLFGYFIGLAVLRPDRAMFLLPLGWLSAAALHASWDGIGTVTDSGVVILSFLILLGLLSYALLAGAIFKAREISPRAAVAAGGPTSATRETAPSSSDWD